MNEQRNKRSLFNVLITNVPGAREHVLLILIVLSVFLLSTLISSYFFVKAIQIGRYGEFILSNKIHLLLFFWIIVSILLFLYSIRVILLISWRVAGPMHRIERFLDDIIEGKDTYITVRTDDALCGIAKRINKLLDMQKNKKS